MSAYQIAVMSLNRWNSLDRSRYQPLTLDLHSCVHVSIWQFKDAVMIVQIFIFASVTMKKSFDKVRYAELLSLLQKSIVNIIENLFWNQ